MKTGLIHVVIVKNQKDNVATARIELKKGIKICITDEETVKVRENIPVGYKMAIKRIRHGGPIIKYGETIGYATSDIMPGDMVHIHNVEGRQGRRLVK